MTREKNNRKITALLLALALMLSLAPEAAALESAPAAENLELETQKNTAVEGVLTARGGAGEPFTFEITTDPVKGGVELGEEGRFVYTPRENKRGRDYFGYRAIDAEGNRSQEATVLIRIQNRKERP